MCNASVRYIHITVNGSDALWFANRVARENMDAGLAGFNVDVFKGFLSFLSDVEASLVRPTTSRLKDHRPPTQRPLHLEVVACQAPQKSRAEPAEQLIIFSPCAWCTNSLLPSPRESASEACCLRQQARRRTTSTGGPSIHSTCVEKGQALG